MASDEPTSDESDESSNEPSSEESGSESEAASGDSLSFGSKAAEAADDSTTSDEDAGAERDDPENGSDASEDSGDSDATEDPDATEDSDASEDTEDEAYDPNKIPPLSERATLFGAWGCVGLVIVVTLVFFVLIKSAIDKIDDYGAVASEDESDEPSSSSGEEPRGEPEERARPPVTRRLEWPTSYPEARAAARIDERPIVIVFTAEYATESLDVFDGVFSNDDIESYLERFFQIVHIDMGLQGTDPSIALCEVEFLPHVCYLHPETEAKLNEDTTGMIGTSALLRELTTARVAYEASAEADRPD